MVYMRNLAQNFNRGVNFYLPDSNRNVIESLISSTICCSNTDFNFVKYSFYSPPW